MHVNTKAALDYYVSINSDSNVAMYFQNMNKVVAAMHVIFISLKAALRNLRNCSRIKLFP